MKSLVILILVGVSAALFYVTLAEFIKDEEVSFLSQPELIVPKEKHAEKEWLHPFQWDQGESGILTMLACDPYLVSWTDVSCHGESDGSAVATPSGSNPPYSYQWSTGETTPIIENLAAGSYTLTLIDGLGQICIENFTIWQPDSISLYFQVTPESYPGAMDGMVDLTPGGGASNYGFPGFVFQWSNGSSQEDLTGIAGGQTYWVTVTDALFCSKTGSVLVDNNPCPVIEANLIITDVTCHSTGDGSASVSPTGGQVPYSVIWSNGSSGLIAEHLEPGNYQVTITDANGCQFTGDFPVTEPPLLNLTLLGFDESFPGALDGAVDLSVTGGTPPYSFQWNTGAMTEDISALPGEGMLYSVTISDFYGCLAMEEVTLQTGCYPAGTACDDGDNNTYHDEEDGFCNCLGIPCPVITSGLFYSNLHCFGSNDGAASVQPSGGNSPYTILWSEGSSGTSVTGLLPGTYWVTITDANSCITVDTFEILEPEVLETDISGTIESFPGARDGSLDLTVSGGTMPYSYLWSNGSTMEDLSNLSGDQQLYSVTVTDALGCQSSEDFVLETGCFPPGTSCDDGNPHTYNDAEDGSCQCTGVPCNLSIDLEKVNPSCYNAGDGNAGIDIRGGIAPFQILWSTGDTTLAIGDLGPGLYSVTVTDSVGCQDNRHFEITQPDPLAMILTPTNETAQGTKDGAINLEVIGGARPFHYVWSTGAITQNIDHLSGDNNLYSVTVTDSRGCIAFDSVRIMTGCLVKGTPCNDHDSSTFDDVQDGNCGCSGTPCSSFSLNAIFQPPSCHDSSDGMIQLHPSGGIAPYIYLWSNGSSLNSLDNLAGGSYRVTVTDHRGCIIQEDFEIPAPDKLSLTDTIGHASGLDAMDGRIQLHVTGGVEPYQFKWQDQSTESTRSGLAVGTYSVTITDINQCMFSDSFSVGVSCPLANQPCDDGDANTYDDQFDQECECQGTICADPDSTNIIFQPVCDDDVTAVLFDTSVFPVDQIIWSNGTSGSYSFLPAGLHFVELTQSNGCISILPFNVPAREILESQISGGDETGANKKDGFAEVTISGGKAPYTILWSNGATGLKIDSLTGNQVYVVEITDSEGCHLRDSIYIAEFVCAGISTVNIPSIKTTQDFCTNQGVITFLSSPESTERFEYSLDGKDFQSGETFSNLEEGTYQPVIRMIGNQCELILEPVEVIRWNFLPQVNPPSACTAADGQILLFLPDFEISLDSSGPWHSDSISGLRSGNYTVFGRETDGTCIKVIAEVQVGQNIPVHPVTIRSSDVPCGGALGAIEVIQENSNYDYSLDKGIHWYANSQEFAVSPGTYQLLLRLDEDCEYLYEEIRIGIAAELQSEIKEIIAPTDCRSADGVIKLAGEDAVYISLDSGLTWTISSIVDGLSVGKQTIWTRDSTGLCHDTLEAVLSAEIDEDLVTIDARLDPSCSDAEDGYLKLVAGDHPESLTWNWSNGRTGPEQGRLKAGVYMVTVSSGEFCQTSIQVELENPAPLQFDLPDLDTTLYCLGQQLELSIENRDLSYSWSRNGEPFAEGPDVIITREGRYQITGRDSMSCQNTREIEINYSNQLFIANFLMASTVEIGNPTQAIETSWPVPDEISWSSSGGIILENNFNQSTFIFDTTGEYEVILYARHNGCMSTIKKTIRVVDEGQLGDLDTSIPETIQMSLYPNPNLGDFNILIELKEPDEVQIRIYNQEGLVVYGRNLGAISSAVHNVNLSGASPGIYTLVAQSSVNWRTVNFVIEN